MLARSPVLSVWQKGADRFPWWPDWRGETAAIVACGPSVRPEEPKALRGRCRVIAIKKSVELCPWADAVYGCDAPWWRHVVGLPKFSGLKLAFDASVLTEYPDLKPVTIKDKFGDKLLFDDPASVGAGGNSGFQALNLATQFGAERILLIGFDAHDQGQTHWYGRNTWGLARNPDESCFKRWRKAFEIAAAQLRAMSVEVVNCSPVSSLKGFRRASIAQALS